MRLRSGWFGLLALSAAVAACGDQSIGSDVDGVGRSPSPGTAPGNAPAAAAQATPPAGSVLASDDQAPDLWFVELRQEPTSRGGAIGALLAEKDQFRQRVAADGLELHERYSYDRLWNGLSVRVAKSELGRLNRIEGVKNVFPVHLLKLDKAGSGPVGGGIDENPTPQLFTAIKMSGADIAHNTLGLTGAKVLVGVIDTGIDYNHPDLGGCFGPNCRVKMGWDFVGDHYDANDNSLLPEPDADPDDCAGHGTHVSGIIGANGAVIGVAPNVSYAAYRVFGCAGSTSTDIMIKAMERAAADGVRVVNMSIGSSFAWPESPEALASNQLVKEGIVVVASIGNSGASGLWAAGSPGIGTDVIGVASVDNTDTAGPAFTISPHDTMAKGGLVGFVQGGGSPVIPITGTFPLVRQGTPTTTNDGCSAFPAGYFAGSIALIRRGTCTFIIKATNALAAGAVGVVLYNNQVGTLTPAVSGITIPVVMASAVDGVAINIQMNAGPVTLAWGTQTTSTPNTVTANLISSFSSFGLTTELGFKPDISAPGGNIYSTWPLELGGYASLSGTSMSSPHVAGTAALLLEAKPSLTASQVRDILQNNAVPELWSGTPANNVPDNTYRQGAGMVRIDAAAVSTAIATPAKIALGESQAGPVTTKISVQNLGVAAVTYNVTHVPAMSTTGTTWLPVGTASGYAGATFDTTVLTVQPSNTAAVSVTLTADPTLPDGSLYGGYIVLTPQGAATGTLRVPYAGFKGDYQALQVLTNGGPQNGFPWLSNLSGGFYNNQPNGTTVTLQNGDLPYLLLHFEHGAREMKIEAFEATKLKPYGTVLDLSYLSQTGTTGGFSAYGWDGTTTLNKSVVKVPNGSYVLKVSVLKALGDIANPAHWETWTTPKITINHP